MRNQNIIVSQANVLLLVLILSLFWSFRNTILLL